MSKPNDSSGPRISLISAAAENNVIGRDGDLPWRLPTDFAYFKRKTTGHAIIMGRKTYESFTHPLPNRVSIVMTRDESWSADHDKTHRVASLDEALDLAKQVDGVARDEVFVIGGGEVYRLALPIADRIYLTRVHVVADGDATFPDFGSEDWKLTSSDRRPADYRNVHPFTFEVWDRVRDQ